MWHHVTHFQALGLKLESSRLSRSLRCLSSLGIHVFSFLTLPAWEPKANMNSCIRVKLLNFSNSQPSTNRSHWFGHPQLCTFWFRFWALQRSVQIVYLNGSHNMMWRKQNTQGMRSVSQLSGGCRVPRNNQSQGPGKNQVWFFSKSIYWTGPKHSEISPQTPQNSKRNRWFLPVWWNMVESASTYSACCGTMRAFTWKLQNSNFGGMISHKWPWHQDKSSEETSTACPASQWLGIWMYLAFHWPAFWAPGTWVWRPLPSATATSPQAPFFSLKRNIKCQLDHVATQVQSGTPTCPHACRWFDAKSMGCRCRSGAPWYDLADTTRQFLFL